jgi:xanthine dehydrogenase FAD-binding subunit
MAGGTDLLLDLRQGRIPPVESLINLSQVRELTGIEEMQNDIFIGAAVPFSEIASSPLIKFHAPALFDACSLIAGPQVRNVATLGGNIVHGLPAADGTIALLSHAATADIASATDVKKVDLATIFVSPGKTNLDQQEDILIGFNIRKRREGEGSAYDRIMRPQGVALPILNGAVWVRLQEKVITDIRISIGPSGPIPTRARQIENRFLGIIPDESAIHLASKEFMQTIKFRTSAYRASSTYREELVEPLLLNLINHSYKRATTGVY